MAIRYEEIDDSRIARKLAPVLTLLALGVFTLLLYLLIRAAVQ